MYKGNTKSLQDTRGYIKDAKCGCMVCFIYCREQGTIEHEEDMDVCVSQTPKQGSADFVILLLIG